VAKKKVSIDYLQFLNAPDKDDNNEFFFTWLNPEGDYIESFRNKNKHLVVKEYQKVRQYLIELKKIEKPVIKTKTKVDESKKKKAKFFESNPLKGTNNKLVTREFLTKALELKVDGYDKEAIANELVRIYKISFSIAMRATDWCYEELAKDKDENQIRTIVLDHGERYDELYKKLIELEAPKVAMKVLRAKENLNNIGSDIFEVQINNIYEQEDEEFVTYGLDNLTKEEQKELFSILKRMDDKNERKRLQLSA